MSAGAVSRVVTPPDPATTGGTLVVTEGEGARYLSAAAQLPFVALVWPVQTIPIFGPNAAANAERITVNDVQGDTLHFDRSDHPVAIQRDWQVALLSSVPSYGFGAVAPLATTADGTDFTLTVRDPTGEISTPETGGSASYPLRLTKSGIWHYRWEADGVPLTEQALFARYSSVLP